MHHISYDVNHLSFPPKYFSDQGPIYCYSRQQAHTRLPSFAYLADAWTIIAKHSHASGRQARPNLLVLEPLRGIL